MTLRTNYYDGGDAPAPGIVTAADMNALSEAANTAEYVANKDQPNGYAGLNSSSQLTHDSIGNAAGLIGKTLPSGAIVGTTDVQVLTQKDLTAATNTFPTLNQSTTGNAATASKLASARTINGNNFDGTGNITNTLDQLGAPLATVSMGGQRLANLADPVNAQDAATKNWVSGIVQNFQFMPTATVVATSALPAGTYNNGSSGVGATFTVTATGTTTVDAHVLAAADKVLLTAQASAFQNGLYDVTTAGTTGVSTVLTRDPAMDSPSEFPGAFVPVSNVGAANPNSLWLANPVGTVVVGTTAIPWNELNRATDLTQGTGISLSGNTVSVDATVVAELSAVQALKHKDLTDATNTFPTFNQSTSGNAATATKLATPRNINGVPFDGTGNITISAGAGGYSVYNVTSSPYSATGNGTSDDSAAIAAAISAASAAGGGIVYFPPGTYLVTANVIVPKTNVLLVGAGIGNTVIKAGTGNTLYGLVYDSTACNHVMIRGITFNQNNVATYPNGAMILIGNSASHDIRITECEFINQATSTNSILLSSAKNITVDHCLFVGAASMSNSAQGIGGSAGCTGLLVTNNIFVGLMTGVEIVGGYDTHIDNNYFYNCGNYGAYIYASTNFTFNDNVCDATFYVDNSGITSEGVMTNSTCLNGVISGNSMYNGPQIGVYAGSADVVVMGNSIYNPHAAGIEVSGAGTTRVNVLGNHIVGAGQSIATAGLGGNGILCTNGSNYIVANNFVSGSQYSGIFLYDGCTNCIIANNVSKNNAQQASTRSGYPAGIQICYASSDTSCTNIILTGNRSYDDQGTQTQPYGLMIGQAGCSGITAWGNDFSGNLTGPLSDVNNQLLMVGNRNSIPFVSSATTTLSIINTLAFFTGTSIATWTLPTLTANAGAEYWIKNRGSATLTIAAAGSDHIYTTSSVSTTTITAGSVLHLVNDGTYWCQC